MPHELSVEECDRLRPLVAELGQVEIARRLGVSRVTLLAAIARLPLRPSSLTQIRLRAGWLSSETPSP